MVLSSFQLPKSVAKNVSQHVFYNRSNFYPGLHMYNFVVLHGGGFVEVVSCLIQHFKINILMSFVIVHGKFRMP